MQINKIVLGATALIALSTTAMAESEVSANVGFTSDYVFRGYSQTDESAAIQGGVDFNHESGLHVGVWGSSIDFNTVGAGSAEIDLYAGFENEVAGFTYDVGGIYYMYPGSDSNLDYDYIEAYFTGGYDFGPAAVSAGVYYSPEFFGDTGDAVYYMAGVDVPLPNEFNLGAHIGRQEIDDSADYTDWAVGINRNWLEFDWNLTYHDTNVDNDDLADGRVVVSVSKSF